MTNDLKSVQVYDDCVGATLKNSAGTGGLMGLLATPFALGMAPLTAGASLALIPAFAGVGAVAGSVVPLARRAAGRSCEIDGKIGSVNPFTKLVGVGEGIVDRFGMPCAVHPNDMVGVLLCVPCTLAKGTVFASSVGRISLPCDKIKFVSPIVPFLFTHAGE